MQHDKASATFPSPPPAPPHLLKIHRRCHLTSNLLQPIFIHNNLARLRSLLKKLVAKLPLHRPDIAIPHQLCVGRVSTDFGLGEEPDEGAIGGGMYRRPGGGGVASEGSCVEVELAAFVAQHRTSEGES